MEDYNFFWIFWIDNKLVTAVLCFGSHIWNQAAKVRVKKTTALTLDPGPVGALTEHVAIENDPLEPVAGISHTVPDTK